MSVNEQPAGFEFQGRFYEWHLSDMGKDLMLIDRIAGIGLSEFLELAEDGVDSSRGPLLLTMVATSLRHGHPEWSIERIVRTVMNLSLSEIVMLEPEGESATPLEPQPSGELSRSPSNGSSLSSTPEASSSSSISSEIPPESGLRGSDAITPGSASPSSRAATGH